MLNGKIRVMNSNVQKAIDLSRSGQQEAARSLLRNTLRANPNDVTAWLWLAKASNTPEKQTRALEACLRFNPDCQVARAELERVRKVSSHKQGQQASTRSVSSPGPIQQRIRAAATNPIPKTAPNRKPKNRYFLVEVLIITTIAIFILAAASAFMIQPPETAGVGSSGLMQPLQEAVNATELIDPLPVPVQTDANNAKSFVYDDGKYTWTLIPRAFYQITGRVLGKRGYVYERNDMRAQLAPYDLALGWGPMSDPAVDEWIEWSQKNRWLYYNWSRGTTSYKDNVIIPNTSNNHLIPANATINTALAHVQINDVIYLEGYLVDVQTKTNGNSLNMATSLSRTDSDEGACEQFYVQRIYWNKEEYH